MTDVIARFGDARNNIWDLRKKLKPSTKYVINLLGGDDTLYFDGGNSTLYGGVGIDTIAIMDRGNNSTNGNKIYEFENVTFGNKTFGNNVYGNRMKVTLLGNASAGVTGSQNTIESRGTNNITINGNLNNYSFNRSVYNSDKNSFHGITVNGNKNTVYSALDGLEMKDVNESVNITVNGTDNTIQASHGLIQVWGSNNKIQANACEIYNYSDSLYFNGRESTISKMGDESKPKKISFFGNAAIKLTIPFNSSFHFIDGMDSTKNIINFSFGNNTKNTNDQTLIIEGGLNTYYYISADRKEVQLYNKFLDDRLAQFAAIRDWGGNDNFYLGGIPLITNGTLWR